MNRQERLEAELGQTIERLRTDYADLGEELAYTLTRALVHRAVHYSVDSGAVDFCALATLLAEMVGHAHRLAHGDNPASPTHRDLQ
jgi:hypothetical protein